MNKLSFSNYQKEPKSLSFEQMQNIHEIIQKQIEFDQDAKELYQDFLEAATRYSSFRANWLLWDIEKKRDQDSYRSSSHNSVIICLTVLMRYLRKQGEDVSWFDILGDESKDPWARKTIGDFACYVVFINSLMAR